MQVGGAKERTGRRVWELKICQELERHYYCLSIFLGFVSFPRSDFGCWFRLALPFSETGEEFLCCRWLVAEKEENPWKSAAVKAQGIYLGTRVVPWIIIYHWCKQTQLTRSCFIFVSRLIKLEFWFWSLA